MAVHLGHHDIADDQARMDAVGLGEGLTAVDTAVHVVVAGELSLQIAADLVVVFGNDDAVATHGLSLLRYDIVLNGLRLFCQ